MSSPSALCAFGHLHPTLRDKRVVEFVGIFGQHVFVQPDRRVGPFSDSGVQRQDLVVARKERLVETLIVRVALFDVAEMPLAMESGCITGFGKHFGYRDFRPRMPCDSRSMPMLYMPLRTA